MIRLGASRMTTEFQEQDLSGASFWGVWLRGATFRDVDFTGVRTHHVLIEDVEIDGHVDGLVINGVDVTDYVNAHDPWQPLRGMIRAGDANSIREAWEALDAAWAQTLAGAATLTEAQRRQRVDGEWSLIETLRHLVFATDKWFTVPLSGGTFHAAGLPNSGSANFPFNGIDTTTDPSEEAVMAARRDAGDTVRRHLAELDDASLTDRVDVPESGNASVLQCWHAVLEEDFEHLRYARRDLAALGDD